MKRNYFKLVGFFFLLFASEILLAQTRQVKFNLVKGTNGISLGKINCITQDKYGFIWFSDQSNRCIIRYDGANMVRYQNDPKEPNSLGGYYPECLFADSSGFIWIGFYGQGLDRFDPVTKTFTHYRHQPDNPGSLSNDFVSAILIDHLGNIWVGNDGGLDLLDPKSGTFKHYRHHPGDTTSLSHNLVRAIYEDKEGDLWIGTGIPWRNNDEGGLNRLDRNTGTFTSYKHDPKNPNSLINNKVRAIFEDSRGTFWIGTLGDGLHTMDKKTGLFTRLTYNPSQPEQLSRTPVKGVDDHITFIKEDAAKQIWIGTFNNGITRYDPATKGVTIFDNDADKTGSFNDNSAWWAYATADGLLWLTTQQANLYKIDIYNNFLPHIGNNPDDGANSFCEENKDIFWIGTSTGLSREDAKNGSTTLFKHEPDNSNSLSDSYINCIIKDKQGDLWIGTSNGLNQYNPKIKRFTRYLVGTTNAGDTKNSVISVLEDKDSNIWVGMDNKGLFMLNKSSGKITEYKNNPADTNSLSGNNVVSLLEDETTDLWVGISNNTGMDRMNRLTGTFKHYLPGLIIGSIYRDADGVIWAGVPEGGLYKYDRQTDNFYSIADINKGVDIPGVISMTGDKDNNLWLTTRRGIYKLNNKRNHVIWYGKENGLKAEGDFSFRGAYTKEDGTLYLGDFTGYYTFNPAHLDDVNTNTRLYFTNFRLNDENIKPTGNGPLRESIYTAKEISLRYNQNVFSFDFSAINFRTSDAFNVYYMLENYDKEWRSSGSDNKIVYFKVPPGKYTLHIRTANSSDGEWIEKSISILISPPWWKTWWAYTGYGLLFIILVYWVDRYQRKRLLEKSKAEAKEKELEQAKEIEKAYHELRNTQSQLIQSEKMASLGELTAGIAHEIQNPLNFVNNFSEVNTELIDELSEEADKGNLDEVKIIAKDIKENEEKINHHGKRADAIVKGMLQHSRSSSGVKEPTDINALCDEYLRLSYHGLRAKDKSFNATMKTDFDDSIGNINIVSQDIGRVLLNLINNAFYAVSEKKKAGVEGYEPTVSVSTKKIRDNVEISVKDNGNGIPESVKEKIFQPFFTTKPTGQGTGLGLSLSYDIVKAHGGELKVGTKEKKGTVFTIVLPA